MPLVAIAAAVLVLPANASADVFFKTPSGNVPCQQSDERHLVECSVFSARTGRGLPVFTLRARGTARRYLSSGNPATEVPILRYGRTKVLLGGAVRCTSRERGLTCRNRSGHGFFLSRERQRRF